MSVLQLIRTIGTRVSRDDAHRERDRLRAIRNAKAISLILTCARYRPTGLTVSPHVVAPVLLIVIIVLLLVCGSRVRDIVRYIVAFTLIDETLQRFSFFFHAPRFNHRRVLRISATVAFMGCNVQRTTSGSSCPLLVMTAALCPGEGGGEWVAVVHALVIAVHARRITQGDRQPFARCSGRFVAAGDLNRVVTGLGVRYLPRFTQLQRMRKGTGVPLSQLVVSLYGIRPKLSARPNFQTLLCDYTGNTRDTRASFQSSSNLRICRGKILRCENA